ncbi:probable gtp diphosphokinase crsh chloroplastic [Phtheirospermum japonicum]|uniref:GTP diphosphokinase n=1 Tax=Phtheirospermum japonicum TaxID=374723 RepID=A0A830BHL6_9LAMI|nr:probable gtp diphosphokinase crsh chloroplastic [Phtheirospermum japonicum]
MDAEVISAGILRQVIEGGTNVSMHQLRDRIGTATVHLLHESMRLNNISSKVDELDDETASALRKFCLTYYDVRAIILDLVLKLDTMRHLDTLPRYKQQMISLEVMKIYAPLAHAVGAHLLSLELEDLSFQYLFPYSYLYIDTWLKSHDETTNIDIYKEKLLQTLRADRYLTEMVRDISVEGRYKSRYSTMKKLLRDGRKPEQVNDILGLRVVLSPAHGVVDSEKACYRAQEIIRSLWKEMPSRSKDYIVRPKANGYKSLHMAVDIGSEYGGRTRPPLMEIQIRTAEMDMLAAGGTASHALYKGGLTDPEEAKRLKAIMMAAAELAALRLKDYPSANLESDHRNRVFRLLDKNGDGKISIEELMEVMEELGAKGEDAREMMQVLDSNSDGSLSSDEFDLFQKQVELMRNLEYRDIECKTLLNKKLHMEDGIRKVVIFFAVNFGC